MAPERPPPALTLPHKGGGDSPVADTSPSPPTVEKGWGGGALASPRMSVGRKAASDHVEVEDQEDDDGVHRHADEDDDVGQVSFPGEPHGRDGRRAVMALSNAGAVE